MSESFPIVVRGWAVCDAPEEIVRELLGKGARPSFLNSLDDGWRVEDPMPPEQPVGQARSLITFESDTPMETLIVPGSQGQPAPPAEAGHEVVRLTIGRRHCLILDARCWYRVAAGPSSRLRLWFYYPL